MTKKLSRFTLIVFLPLFIIMFLSFFAIPAEPQEAQAIVAQDLLALAENTPEKTVILVLALDTNNEGMLEEIEEATQPYEEELIALADSFNEKDDVSAKKIEQTKKAIKKKRAQKNKVILRMLKEEYNPIQKRVAYALQKIPATTIIYQDFITNKVVIETKAKYVPDVSALYGVHEIILDVEDTDEADVSVPTTGALTWHNNGYGGFPFDILFINSNGIRINLPSFNHIIFLNRCFISASCNPTNPSSDHDTLVTGIIGSNHATYKGVSNSVDEIYNARTNSFFQATQAVAWAIDGIPPDAGQITMSKAFGGGTPPYCGDTLQEEYVDEIVDLFDVNWVKSAGNEGNNANTDVTLPAGAYNIIAVGASDDRTTTTRNDDRIASFSSRGPVYVCGTSQTRIKPDLVAPGSVIRSTSNTPGVFIDGTGTSFSAPHVAGAMLLIDDYMFPSMMSAMEMRALLLNTAEDRDALTSLPGSDGPDNNWGYGYLDLDNAYTEIDNTKKIRVNSNNPVFLKQDPVQAKDKVTMVWDRHIVNNAGVTDNLDLFVYEESNNNLLGSSVHAGRNIEQVVFGQAHGYNVIKLQLTTPQTGNNEDVGLATSNPTTNSMLVPIQFSTAVTAPQVIACDAHINVTTTITNQGELTAHDVTASIILPPGFTIISGTNPENVGNIFKAATMPVTWTVQVAGGGPATLGVDISSDSYGEQYTASNNRPINVGSPEVCDGIDNDCDGVIDEGCPLQHTAVNCSIALQPNGTLVYC